MKIAILTSGILPVPAVQGGAVENLIDFYLEYNDKYHIHDITVFSIAHQATKNHHALLSPVNHYHFIDTNSLKARLKRKIRECLKPKGDYYNSFIEYYFEEAYKTICLNKYDCILLENRPGYAKKLFERGINNIVLHLHNDLLNNTTQYHNIIYGSLSRILTVSNYISFCVSTIEQSNKIVTIHNGINLSQFSQRSQTSLRRRDIVFNDKDFVLIYSGRINKEKGITELLDAMLLLQNNSSIKLLVIGSTFFGNTPHDDEFVLSLKTKAKPIEQRIIFTGYVPYDQMPDYLQLADVAVIPSIWDDPFPTTVLEAQAMGLPIITTRRGGIPEEVTEKNAILLDTNDNFVENLANAILDLYENPKKRKAMARTSLERSKLFDKEKYAEEFFRAINNS